MLSEASTKAENYSQFMLWLARDCRAALGQRHATRAEMAMDRSPKSSIKNTIRQPKMACNGIAHFL
jgi:hypothetical protein